MAQDLAKYLEFGPGKDGVVMAPTLGGQMNAMDIQVSGVYDAGRTHERQVHALHLRFRPVSLRYAKGREGWWSSSRTQERPRRMRSLLLGKLTDAGMSAR